MNYTNAFYYGIMLLLTIIFLFCLISVTCKNTEYFNAVNEYKKRANYLPEEEVLQEFGLENFDNPPPKYARTKDGRLVPTDPIHVPVEDANKVFLGEDDEEEVENFELPSLFKKKASEEPAPKELIREVQTPPPMDALPSNVQKNNNSVIMKPDAPQPANTQKQKEEINTLMTQINSLQEKIKKPKVALKKPNTAVIPQIALKKPSEVPEKPSVNLKFFSSEKCSKEYPHYTGASIEGTNLKCDKRGQTAKVMASISNGKIRGVQVLEQGKGYKEAPQITIKGTGRDAILKTHINKEGELYQVSVVNGGEGFNNTPDLFIDPPNLNSICYLCSK